MKRILKLGEDELDYVDIFSTDYSDGTLEITLIKNKTITKNIDTCTDEDLSSLYDYCIYKNHTNWFRIIIGTDKLPQEYRFMEL